MHVSCLILIRPTGAPLISLLQSRELGVLVLLWVVFVRARTTALAAVVGQHQWRSMNKIDIFFGMNTSGRPQVTTNPPALAGRAQGDIGAAASAVAARLAHDVT
jgi:hypothetical protein